MQLPLPAITRRLIVLTCMTLFGAIALAAEPRLPVVTVNEGQLAGIAGTDPSITVFKGIPYAAPPVGERRWKPPQPPLSWSGVRKADTFGASPMQAMQRSFGPWTEEYMFRNDVSEDCLFLNVWTPAKTTSDRLPVFVYVPGGAYSSGSGEVLLYDGGGLAKKGVIVVTLNYRVGVFGFLAHPELTAESPHHASGNYGLMDQLAALRWVKANIAALGGDPTRVTVGGQSAGAGSVHYLTISTEARNLFQRGDRAERPGSAFRPSADASRRRRTRNEIRRRHLRDLAGRVARVIRARTLRALSGELFSLPTDRGRLDRARPTQGGLRARSANRCAAANGLDGRRRQLAKRLWCHHRR